MAVRPPLANESISASPRFAVITSLSGDVDMLTTYGSLTREIHYLGTSAADLIVRQSSPYDNTGSNDMQTIPLPQPWQLAISVTVIDGATTALPLLLLF